MPERWRDAGKLSLLEWGSCGIGGLIGARAARLALGVSSTGAGGWSKERPARGAAQVGGRSFDCAGGRVGRAALGPWPSTRRAYAMSCRSLSRMSHQVARSTKPTESSTCCIVAPPVEPGLDEPEPGVAHAPSAGLGAGDDGFVARRSSVMVPKTVRR